MALGGDPVEPNGAPPESLAAQRAAQLCEVAEASASEAIGSSDHLRYIVGTEVPPPGGETSDEGIRATEPADAVRTIEVVREALAARGLEEAWSRVRGLVVQPGVDSAAWEVVDYDRSKARPLVEAIGDYPSLVYEAHSPDYQRPQALRELVE